MIQVKEAKKTKIIGLTADMEVCAFNRAKEEVETMTVKELLLNHMSGMVDYAVLGWNADKKDYEFYHVDTVYLDDKNIPSFEYTQTQSDQKFYTGKNNQTRVLMSDGSLKKLNKVKPTDTIQLRTGHDKEPVLHMANWVQSNGPEKDVFEVTILEGKSLVVNGLAFFSS